MEEREATARWVRRIGAVAALAILALLLGELSVHESRSETPPSEPAPSVQPDKRYGPNPNYRLTPQIDRIIRLAQRNKTDDDKIGSSGGTRLKKTAPVEKKAAPVRKKETAPVRKKVAPAPKKTAPVVRKKETAPVKKKVAPVKKKETAPVKKKVAPVKKETVPVVKKKETTPVNKDTPPAVKKEIAPVTKEVAPAEQPPPESGPSQQEQENVDFCAQNPNDPSCSKGAPPPGDTEATEPAPATEKICTANPKYPGCDKLKPPPDLGGAKGEEEGGVGSICEQNPQLPQCQQGEETTQPDKAVEGPPEAPDADDGAPPGFPPPGDTPPIPPGPPPSPPPADDDEEPTGPTIQTVDDDCPAGQVAWGDQCLYAGNCPPGEVSYTDYSVDPPHAACGTSCPEGMFERLGGCIGGTVCFNQGGVHYEGECLLECPPGTEGESWCQAICTAEQVRHQGQCLDACPANTIQEGEDCVPGCPEGQFLADAGVCTPSECPEGQYRDVNQLCVAECGEGTTPTFNQTNGYFCMQQCPEGQLAEFTRCVESCGTGYDYQMDGQCLTRCPQDRIEHEGQCLAECPSGTITHQGQCLTECPDNTELILNRCLPEQDCPGDQLHLETGASFEGACVDSCPEGMLDLSGRCIGSAVCGMWGGINYEGQCLESCPAEAVTLEGGIGCASQCPSGTVNVGGQCTTCPEGQHALNNECRPICEYGQFEIEGTCRPIEEIGYEEFIEQCAAAVDGTSGEQVEVAETLYGNLVDAGGARFCQIMVDNLCNRSEELAGAPLCADRVPPCPEGELIAGDGGCTAQCDPDQVVFEDMCRSECLFGTNAFQGECRRYCPGGHEATDGQCVAGCAPGLTAGADGQCTNPCPEGQTFHRDQCRETCPEGQGYIIAHCHVCNHSAPNVVVDGASYHYVNVNGVCASHPEVPYEDALATCMGGGYGYGMPGGSEHTEAECGQALAGQCQQEDFEDSRFCAELPEGATPRPADGETPVAEGPTDWEAPSEGESPPPGDDAAPPPPEEDGALPPDGTAPPPDETTPPPPDETAPPPEDGEASPPEDQAPPPPDEGAPPPEDGEAPPPPDETAPPPPPEDEAPPQHSGCAEGTFVPMHPQNGECLAQCPPGTVGNDSGYCVSEIPDDQPPPPDDETAPPPDETAPPRPDETAPPPGGTPLPPLPFPGAPPAPPPAEETKPTPPAAKVEAAPEAAPAKPVAVVIGIGDYKNADIPAAPQAIGNAAHVVRFLKDDLGLDGLRILTGRNASLSDFEDIFGKPGDAKGELRELMRKENPSEVIVYVSGRALGVNGGKDVLLLPADADLAKPETALSLAQLYNRLAAMGVPTLRLYLDPAFVKGDDVVKVQTGPMIGPAGLLTPRHWVALSAASDSAAVPDDKDKPRSRFTESLIAGLRGIADTTGEGSGDGTVSAEELYLFIKDQAAAAAKRGQQAPVPSLHGAPKELLRSY